MRTFDYRNLPKDLFNHAAGDMNVLLYEDRGKMSQLCRFHADILDGLQQQALVENVEASAHIEGLYPDSGALRKAVLENDCGDDDLAQYVGYARALRVINEHAADLELSSATLVELYEQLYCNRIFGKRSRYRKNDYMQTWANGHAEVVPVSPIPAFETPLVLGAACDSLANAFNVETCSPLVLSAVFTVDFLCIRPFETGNGRVSRLFANLLLQKAGFDVARYVSLDAIIEERASEYYDALNNCVEGWDRARNDYTPYVLFWLGVIHAAYTRLFERMDIRIDAGKSKSSRVRLFLAHADGPVSKRQILEAHPDISISTVENALGALVRERLVEKRGAGRSTSYVWRDGAR